MNPQKKIKFKYHSWIDSLGSGYSVSIQKPGEYPKYLEGGIRNLGGHRWWVDTYESEAECPPPGTIIFATREAAAKYLYDWNVIINL